MTKTTFHDGNKIANDWHADTKFYLKPKIVKTENGFLVDDKGNLHIPEVFNRVWGVVKQVVKAKRYKGITPAKKNRFIIDEISY